MKRLDDSTLEAIAETICGAGEGGGGGYRTPGPYRTKAQAYEFFRRAGVNSPKGMSSTRKWFVLESLQAVNGTPLLDGILRRLASPREYRGDAATMQVVTDHLNEILQVEGLELYVVGVDPEIRERRATVSAPKPKEVPIEASPDFEHLVGDPPLAGILKSRWAEAQRCFRADAHLSSVVMMGSILEGVLLHKVECNMKTACQAKAVPRDKTGLAKPSHEWSLSALIDVAHEVGWLQGDVKRFSHALRESRNIVHPYFQRVLKERPDGDTCRICWQVVRAAVADLLEVDKQAIGEAQP
ncbi:MAG TPA: hypothetical protein VLH79_14505 [Chthonomonadales bacterium]|nr:hypothetical protein [Chthonomonadales bacterium]